MLISVKASTQLLLSYQRASTSISLSWMASGITNQKRCVYQLYIMWADHRSTHCAADNITILLHLSLSLSISLLPVVVPLCLSISLSLPPQPAIPNRFGTYNNVVDLQRKHVDAYYEMWDLLTDKGQQNIVLFACDLFAFSDSCPLNKHLCTDRAV